VRITVSDDGEGMAPETVARAFEPFFTTKEAGKGTGLGLATVYGIVTQNRGAIDVRSERKMGTTFEIYLPHQTEARQNINSSTCPGVPVEGKETVLIVEDEPALLRLTASILGRLGYSVLSASSPAQALRIAREHSGHIHLLLSDVVMPEMNGVELSTLMLSIRPGIKRLFMSGYAADILARQGMNESEVRLVSKPFTIETLASKIRDALRD
jgi:CheY-like chemotaxis protein